MSSPITYIAWFCCGYAGYSMFSGVGTYGALVAGSIGYTSDQTGKLISTASSRLSLAGIGTGIIFLIVGLNNRHFISALSILNLLVCIGYYLHSLWASGPMGETIFYLLATLSGVVFRISLQGLVVWRLESMGANFFFGVYISAILPDYYFKYKLNFIDPSDPIVIRSVLKEIWMFNIALAIIQLIFMPFDLYKIMPKEKAEKEGKKDEEQNGKISVEIDKPINIGSIKDRCADLGRAFMKLHNTKWLLICNGIIGSCCIFYPSILVFDIDIYTDENRAGLQSKMMATYSTIRPIIAILFVLWPIVNPKFLQKKPENPEKTEDCPKDKDKSKEEEGIPGYKDYMIVFNKSWHSLWPISALVFSLTLFILSIIAVLTYHFPHNVFLSIFRTYQFVFGLVCYNSFCVTYCFQILAPLFSKTGLYYFIRDKLTGNESITCALQAIHCGLCSIKCKLDTVKTTLDQFKEDVTTLIGKDNSDKQSHSIPCINSELCEIQKYINCYYCLLISANSNAIIQSCTLDETTKCVSSSIETLKSINILKCCTTADCKQCCKTTENGKCCCSCITSEKTTTICECCKNHNATCNGQLTKDCSCTQNGQPNSCQYCKICNLLCHSQCSLTCATKDINALNCIIIANIAILGVLYTIDHLTLNAMKSGLDKMNNILCEYNKASSFLESLDEPYLDKSKCNIRQTMSNICKCIQEFSSGNMDGGIISFFQGTNPDLVGGYNGLERSKLLLQDVVKYLAEAKKYRIDCENTTDDKTKSGCSTTDPKEKCCIDQVLDMLQCCTKCSNGNVDPTKQCLCNDNKPEDKKCTCCCNDTNSNENKCSDRCKCTCKCSCSNKEKNECCCCKNTDGNKICCCCNNTKKDCCCVATSGKCCTGDNNKCCQCFSKNDQNNKSIICCLSKTIGEFSQSKNINEIAMEIASFTIIFVCYIAYELQTSYLTVFHKVKDTRRKETNHPVDSLSPFIAFLWWIWHAVFMCLINIVIGPFIYLGRFIHKVSIIVLKKFNYNTDIQPNVL